MRPAIGLAAVAATLFLAAPAGAMMRADNPPRDGAIQPVAEGCGYGARRDVYGRCVLDRVRPDWERRRHDEFREEHRRERMEYRRERGELPPRCVVRMTPLGPRRFCD